MFFYIINSNWPAQNSVGRKTSVLVRYACRCRVWFLFGAPQLRPVRGLCVQACGRTRPLSSAPHWCLPWAAGMRSCSVTEHSLKATVQERPCIHPPRGRCQAGLCPPTPLPLGGALSSCNVPLVDGQRGQRGRAGQAIRRVRVGVAGTQGAAGVPSVVLHRPALRFAASP